MALPKLQKKIKVNIERKYLKHIDKNCSIKMNLFFLEGEAGK